jgi:hypothetical protein
MRIVSRPLKRAARLVCAAVVRGAAACAVVACVALTSCGMAGFEEQREPAVKKKDRTQGRATDAENRAGGYGQPEALARLEDKSLDESSGLAASQMNAGIIWTHNDSGQPLVYAFDMSGRPRGVWEVDGAKLYDWEDMARGPGPGGGSYLYVADIGDNRLARREIIVYRFPEPIVSEAAASSDRKRPLKTEPAEAIRLRYPDGAHDAEALLVHPRTGDLYIVTKIALQPASIYKLAAPRGAAGTSTLERIGEFLPPTLAGGLMTGGDIAPDGRGLVLCDYANGYELRVSGDGAAFDTIWRQSPTKFSLGERGQGEAVAYTPDGAAVLATSEGARPPLFRVTRPR